MLVSFGSKQDDYLHRLIETLQSTNKYTCDFVIFCTHLKQWGNNVEVHVYDESVGFDLTLQPYIWMQQNMYKLSNYDYILYTENDILITEQNIDEFIRCNEILQAHNACCGFIRYELKDNEKYILDFINPITDSKVIDGIEYIITTQNVHSGCWLLAYDQLMSIANNFIYIGSSLEDRASNVYYSPRWPGSLWGIEKLIPKASFKNLLVHHMTDKYVVDLNTPHGKLHIDHFINEN